MKSLGWIGWSLVGVLAAVLAVLVTVDMKTNQPASTSTPEPKKVGGPEKIAGISPRDIPVMMHEAMERQDGLTLDKYYIDDKKVLAGVVDLKRGPHGEDKDYTIDPLYKLTEYKANNSTYYYVLSLPRGSTGYKVVRTKKGWRTFYHYSRPDWDYETQDLTPVVIKGVHDKP